MVSASQQASVFHSTARRNAAQRGPFQAQRGWPKPIRVPSARRAALVWAVRSASRQRFLCKRQRGLSVLEELAWRTRDRDCSDHAHQLKSIRFEKRRHVSKGNPRGNNAAGHVLVRLQRIFLSVTICLLSCGLLLFQEGPTRAYTTGTKQPHAHKTDARSAKCSVLA